ncbi:TetR/AcrR family transcriptional regulator [Kocuria sediminis]|uniref:TetR/AcrR family transcriptional regulator n=1 Tax=Kocuria sediminis TaxID=1038857 RepID=UPI001390D2B7|nr:TetR/AcrR family transcriptional regulator [Kocuria sediminis]
MSATGSTPEPRPSRSPGRVGRPAVPIDGVVLAATLEELAVAGPHALSVDRVARRAGVHRTSVYRRWPDRGSLVVAALEHQLDALGAPADTGRLRTDLASVLGPLARHLATPGGRALLLVALADGVSGEVEAVVARRLAATEQPLDALVRRARDRGEWGPGVSAAEVADALVGAALHRVVMLRQPVTDEWVDAVCGLLARGAAAGPGSGG